MRATARIMEPDEAVRLIRSGTTVGVSGFVGAGHPEMLTAALEKRFLREGEPRDLTLYYCAGQGDGADRGLNHFAHTRMLKRVIGGHWNLAPKLGKMALHGEIEAYNLPQGILSCLLRESAAGRPGILSEVGMNTFIDPNQIGGRLNDRTRNALVERVAINGHAYLFYHAVPIDVALIRATKADERGNLTLEHEGLVGEVLPMAQAAHNNGGIVIAQVETLRTEPADPKAVRVPGLLVDAVVVSKGRGHDQTFAEKFNPSYVSAHGELGQGGEKSPEIRRRIGARALAEIKHGDIVNLGIGLPETVAEIAAEQGRLGDFTLTVESGPTGGRPASGLSFGCSQYPEAIIDQPAQFDFYDGGGIDIAILGAIEVDESGSVNVASFGDRFAGVGGFVNIATSAKRLVFCCTLQAKGRAKFVQSISHVCFHGPSAFARGQDVLYVTESGVFRLSPEGLCLVELAPGVTDVSAVLDRMQFTPRISPQLLNSRN